MVENKFALYAPRKKVVSASVLSVRGVEYTPACDSACSDEIEACAIEFPTFDVIDAPCIYTLYNTLNYFSMYMFSLGHNAQ